MDSDENSVSIDPKQLARIHNALRGITDTKERAIDSFKYSNPFEPTAFRLIEVTKEIADHVLDGKEFYLSGLPEDEMVLCTTDRTFKTKEIERSNSMMLTTMDGVPSTEGNSHQKFRGIEVLSVVNRNIELTESPLYKPTRFRDILINREINIFEDDPALLEKITVEEFCSELPLSRGQVRRLLEDYPVFEIDGSLYCLNTQGREELMEGFAYFLEDCNYDRVMRSDLTESSIFASINSNFEQAKESILEWVFRMFFERIDGTHILRKHAKNRFTDVQELERLLYRRIPSNIQFELNHLRGVALVKKAADGETVLKYFNSEDLSLNEKERLEELFNVSTSWSFEDIEPYVLDFVDSKKVYEFISKRCRSGTVGGKTVFYRL